jgi:hypothetical protein
MTGFRSGRRPGRAARLVCWRERRRLAPNVSALGVSWVIRGESPSVAAGSAAVAPTCGVWQIPAVHSERVTEWTRPLVPEGG